MGNVEEITSTVRVNLKRMKKEIIIVNRENIPSEFIIIDKNSKGSVDKLNSFVDFEKIFNIPCTEIEL